MDTPILSNSRVRHPRLWLSAVATCMLLGGCVAGSVISHDDAPAAVQSDQGPDLCRDGTLPPCTPRS